METITQTPIEAEATGLTQEGREATWAAEYAGAALQQLGEAQATAHYAGDAEKRDFMSRLIEQTLTPEQKERAHYEPIEIAKATATTGRVAMNYSNTKHNVHG